MDPLPEVVPDTYDRPTLPVRQETVIRRTFRHHRGPYERGVARTARANAYERAREETENILHPGDDAETPMEVFDREWPAEEESVHEAPVSPSEIMLEVGHPIQGSYWIISGKWNLKNHTHRMWVEKLKVDVESLMALMSKHPFDRPMCHECDHERATPCIVCLKAYVDMISGYIMLKLKMYSRYDAKLHEPCLNPKNCTFSVDMLERRALAPDVLAGELVVERQEMCDPEREMKPYELRDRQVPHKNYGPFSNTWMDQVTDVEVANDVMVHDLVEKRTIVTLLDD